MAAGDATAADVPGKYDCVINGKGYVFADSIEPSLPFRTHRAIYDISQTFVERQNVSNIYGDQAQDFFLTAHQEDWSLGQGQRFFRANDPSSVRRFFTSSGLDLSFPGQLALTRSFIHSVNASKAIAISNTQTPGVFAYRSTGATASLKTIDTSGTLVDKGDPGAGTQSQWGICTDGVSTFIAGSTTIRRWDGAAYSDFGAANTNAGALAFHNNALYSCNGSVLKQYDGTGTATTVFTWKDATNTALPAFGQHPKILSWGGKLLIFFPQLERKPKLYVYDGTGVSLLAELPVGTTGYDLYEVDGIIFMSAGVSDLPGGMESTSFGAYAAVYYLSDGTLGELWRDTRFLGSLSKNLYGLPALGGIAGRLIFASAGNVYTYDVGTGAISLIGTVPLDSSPLTGQSYEVLACDPSALLYGESGSGRIDARVYPATTYGGGQLVTSWFDFDSSLTKSFRGVTLDWTSANDGSIDIQYEVDGGILTTLQTGASTGTEYTFPAATSGHKIRLTLNFNMGSTAAPILKRLSIRAAPQLKQFRSGTYILDCTGSPDEPRELRDGEYQPLTGYEQVQNLLTAAKATTPFTVVDRLGSFTALIDLSDAEGFDIYEVHPNTDNPKKSGSYFARIKVREV